MGIEQPTPSPVLPIPLTDSLIVGEGGFAQLRTGHHAGCPILTDSLIVGEGGFAQLRTHHHAGCPILTDSLIVG